MNCGCHLPVAANSSSAICSRRRTSNSVEYKSALAAQRCLHCELLRSDDPLQMLSPERGEQCAVTVVHPVTVGDAHPR
jgi:hypothetical protein